MNYRQPGYIWIVETPWGVMTNFKSLSEAMKVFRALAWNIPGWVMILNRNTLAGFGASTSITGERELYRVIPLMGS